MTVLIHTLSFFPSFRPGATDYTVLTVQMDSVRILQLKRGVEELESRVTSLEQQVDNGDLLAHHYHSTSTDPTKQVSWL